MFTRSAARNGVALILRRLTVADEAGAACALKVREVGAILDGLAEESSDRDRSDRAKASELCAQLTLGVGLRGLLEKRNP